MALFSELNKRDGITIVLITHEADIAAYAQRLVRLADGRVVYDGPVAQDPYHAHAGTAA
jgi:putative ABC transport system ATP-binding protein